MIREKEEELSLQARLVRELIAKITNEYLIGRKIKNGELRKKLVEPQWKCPPEYRTEYVQMPEFAMEYISPVEQKRKDRVILQLHGGGYIGGVINVHRNMATLYSQAGGGCDVLLPDYRVAPEHPFPGALLDAQTAYEWLLKEGYDAKQIFVCGDSAGGGLAMALCHKCKRENIPLPGGIVAMSPWTDMTASGPSYEENYEKDVLFGNTKESMIYCTDYRQDHDPTDPYLSPLFGDFTEFPPMLIQVGTYEMLLSDARLVAQKAHRQGVKVRLSEYEGMFHVFQMGLLRLPESCRAWKEVEHFFETLDGYEAQADSEPAKQGLLPSAIQSDDLPG